MLNGLPVFLFKNGVLHIGVVLFKAKPLIDIINLYEIKNGFFSFLVKIQLKFLSFFCKFHKIKNN